MTAGDWTMGMHRAAERFEAWLAVQTEPVTFAPTQAGEPAAEDRRLRAVT